MCKQQQITKPNPHSGTCRSCLLHWKELRSCGGLGCWFWLPWRRWLSPQPPILACQAAMKGIPDPWAMTCQIVSILLCSLCVRAPTMENHFTAQLSGDENLDWQQHGQNLGLMTKQTQWAQRRGSSLAPWPGGMPSLKAFETHLFPKKTISQRPKPNSYGFGANMQLTAP